MTILPAFKRACQLLLFSLFVALPASAKDPITEGETSPVMLDLDPYLIDALYGKESGGKTGRFGKEGGMANLLEEPAFVELVKKHDLSLIHI